MEESGRERAVQPCLGGREIYRNNLKTSVEDP